LDVFSASTLEDNDDIPEALPSGIKIQSISLSSASAALLNLSILKYPLLSNYKTEFHSKFLTKGSAKAYVTYFDLVFKT